MTHTISDEIIWKRCFDLAELGGRLPRPNPSVGCVIIASGKIIGEGHTSAFGGNHAEVNAFLSIPKSKEKEIPNATVYVTLEPCAHFGSTPPCADLLVRKGVKCVKIASKDPFEKVNSKGIEKLKSAGIKVEIIEVKDPSRNSLQPFFCNTILKKPFVQLKFAKSADNFMGQSDHQVHLTNQYTNVYTHKKRAFTDGILIGTNTASIDNPSLTLRHYPGDSPTRIVLDRTGRLDETLTIFDGKHPTIILSETKKELRHQNIVQVILNFDSEHFIQQLLSELFKLGINHLMVEGGKQLLTSFIKQNAWDEAYIIHTQSILKEGTKAPNLHGKLFSTLQIENDTIQLIKNQKSQSWSYMD